MKIADLAKKVTFTYEQFKVMQSEKPIIKLSPTFNSICGGIKGGSFVLMGGPPKCGKTITCLDFAARAQKSGYTVLYLNSEGRLAERDIEGCSKLDYSEDKIKIVTSSSENKVSAEQYLGLVLHYMEKEERLFVIADSLSYMEAEKQLNDSTCDLTRDTSPRIMSQFCKKLAPYISSSDHIFLGVVHLIANTSGYGKAIVESGGNKIQYAADIKLRLKNYEPIIDADIYRDREYGRKINWVCETSNMGFPRMEGTSYVILGEGIDDVAELLPIALETGVMSKGGAWYNYGEEKFQGEKKAIEALRNNPEMYEEVKKEVEARLA